MNDISAILGIIYVILVVLIAATMTLYATYLFVRRIKHGQPKAKSFFSWLKHLFEIIMGL